MPKTEYFMRDWGLKLFRNGYEPIPIAVGEKRPDFSNAKGDPDWRRIPIDEKIIQKWVSNGKAINGVGGRTATMPTLDVDCMDAKMQLEYRNRLTEEGITLGLVKWGQPPKTSYVYRTSRPFTKLTGVEWVDDKGRKAQCEFLGDGQQTVLFAVHPDTQEPYRWKNHVNPLNTRWIDLEETDADIAKRCVDIFDEMAEARGWERKRRTSGNLPARVRNNDPEWIGDDGTEPVQDLSDEQVAEIVRSIENDDRFDLRDDWYRFGMAISHQLDHSELAKELFYEWSEQRPQRPGELDKVWKSIKDQDSRENITFRHIIKIHRAQATTEAVLSAQDFVDRLDKSKTDSEIASVCAEAQRVDMPPLLKNQVVDALQKAYLRLHQSKLPIGDARHMVMYKRQRGDGLPKWAEDWCYVAEIDRFLNTKSNQMLKSDSFDRMYGSYVFKGETANKYALDQLGIPKFDLALYLPEADRVFPYDGKKCVNTYSEKNVPAIPDKLSRDDQRAVETVEAHLQMLIEDDRDRAMFISFMSWIVKTRRRLNFAMVLIGIENDGKTTMFRMMGNILGGDNIKTITAETVIETHFTGWAGGSLLACIEEIRIQGQNRFLALNKIKDKITNPVVEIHEKNINAYNAPNTQSYMLTSNYEDALPLTNGDTRYYVIHTRHRTNTDFDEWFADHPEHFNDLNSAIDNHAGALRGWLMDYQPHPDFDGYKRAPFSQGKMDMIALNKSDDSSYLAELIELDNVPGVSATVLLTGDLTAAVNDKFDIELTPGHAMAALLRSEGFVNLGRVRLPTGYQGLWSKMPKMLPNNPYDRAKFVRKHIQQRRDQPL